MGSFIYGVVVIDGSLYSRFYGTLNSREQRTSCMPYGMPDLCPLSPLTVVSTISPQCKKSGNTLDSLGAKCTTTSMVPVTFTATAYCRAVFLCVFKFRK